MNRNQKAKLILRHNMYRACDKHVHVKNDQVK